MGAKFDRRDALKWIGGLLLGGPVLGSLSGCGGDDGEQQKAGEPNHPVPHPEDNTVPDVEATAEALGGASRSPGIQQPKEKVKYQHVPNGTEHCGSCSLYVPDQNGDGFGACTTVAGTIHPCDWCNLYVEYSGKGTVACEQA